MIFNQYSFVLLAAVAIAATAFIMWRANVGPLWLRMAIMLILIAAAVVVWAVMHPTVTPAITTLEDANRLIGNGKPTVIEFFSEY